jgi:hypothetical protein
MKDEKILKDLSEEILVDMDNWNKSNTNATLLEIEEKSRELTSKLEVALIEKTALEREEESWSKKGAEECPSCPTCHISITSRGKRERTLQGAQGREIHLKRTYGTCPNCGVGFFPLDEKLGLQPGSLTPLQLSYVVNFASYHSFEETAQMMSQHHGVQVSACTACRQAEAIGACAESVQNEQANAAYLQEGDSSKKGDVYHKEDVKYAISSDGSFVSLRGNVYAEVKTAVVGEVHENKRRSSRRPDQEVRMTDITYFSRMAPAETFTELSIGEMDRRGIFQAKQVCAVSDGAEWIQHFVDAHRAKAVRILDFYHATEYLSNIATLVRDAGTKLKDTWFDEQCHELKHYGPKNVLKEVHRLLRDHPQIEELERSVNYLQKREHMMQYPLFQQQGWPIGSGSAESSQTCVVQARLKGAGMHWNGKNVNPMLALRTGVCNDRWEETRNQAFQQRLAEKRSNRVVHQKKRYEKLKQNVEHNIIHFLHLFTLHQSRTTQVPVSSYQEEPEILSPDVSYIKKACIPASSHPWRRYAHAKK